ncbi:MAG: family 16 glycosylhydrolase [Eubacterium sp.]|nr:family 16 glycosylhydrolase [Eubacterium sp.]
MKKKIVCAALAAAMSMTLLAGCGSSSENTTAATETTEAPTTASTTAATEITEAATEPVTEEVTEAYKPEEPDEYQEYPNSAEYHLVWEENFDYKEKKLPAEDWVYEVHKPGWVNRELQAYVNSEEYAYVKNGELVIQPKKEVDDKGNVSYYSGRVNTNNKHDFKYGRMEAKIKVPSGKGFLPAFWMMPTKSALYGSWPRCGEIDIMEVVSNDPTRDYGSIHFGDPHTQRQGSVSNGSDYSKEYHVFAVEWEPGLIRWYVDGVAFYETSDWFTASGSDVKPYPAPFNQDFHIILNVAVGGDWPGEPDPDLVFDENTAMYVDYVRVYQKDSYDENVEKPAEELHMKEADSTGNYVNNGDFAAPENLNDDQDWVYQNLNKGVGKAEIKNGEMLITIENEGTEDYSIQLVQGGLPMVKGQKYKYSFEACADDPRTMITAITGPDVSWLRYFEDTKMDLTKDWQSFSYEFEMKEEDDDNGRIEFDLGKQGSTAAVHIRNVRLEKVQ